jgi:hypothetical protein
MLAKNGTDDKDQSINSVRADSNSKTMNCKLTPVNQVLVTSLTTALGINRELPKTVSNVARPFKGKLRPDTMRTLRGNVMDTFAILDGIILTGVSFTK